MQSLRQVRKRNANAMKSRFLSPSPSDGSIMLWIATVQKGRYERHGDSTETYSHKTINSTSPSYGKQTHRRRHSSSAARCEISCIALQRCCRINPHSSYKILPEIHLTADTAILPLHTNMFAVCCRSHSQARATAGTLSCRKKNPEMSPLGRLRL